jgi:6-phosphogluconolactonase (cycloisomerase 2 family)
VGTRPVSVTVDPSGKFIYVANIGSNDVSAFAINSNTGELIGLSPSTVAARLAPSSIAITGGNSLKFVAKFAYVANTNSNNLSAFSVDETDGALTNAPGSPFPTGQNPNAIGVDLFGKFAVATNTVALGANNASAFKIDPTTGTLTTAAGSPFNAGIQPQGVTIDPSSRFAYLLDHGTDTIAAFTINATTGALTAVPGSPFAAGFNPIAAAVDPSGRFLYVANSDSNNVSAFSINPTSGALTNVAGSPFIAGTNSSSVTVDPSGRYLFVGNSRSNNISAYLINSKTGALNPIAGSPFTDGNSPLALAVDPAGKFLYVANDLTNTVSAFVIIPDSGAINPISGFPFNVEAKVVDLSVDPSGKFLYVLVGTDRVSVFAINNQDGTVTAVSGSFATGTGAAKLTISGGVQ